MIVGKIDVTKIDKSAIFVGKKGKYFDFALFENRDGTDEYGNDGFMVQNLPKAQRDAGKKNPIIANWRHQETRSDTGRQKMHGSDARRDVPASDTVGEYHQQRGTPSRGWNPPQAPAKPDDEEDVPF
jgi:hypothetical protein